MNFLPDILTTLGYAAVIPVYALFIYLLASKKKKNNIAIEGKIQIDNVADEASFSGASESSPRITTAEGEEFNLSNLISNESKIEENQYQILHKLVEIGVKKVVEGCFDEELLSLSWYRSN